MKFLVLYATVEGHTHKIADSIAAQLESLGGEVFLTNVIDPGYCDPGMADAAILCAPIHIGNYPSTFVQYIQNWKSALQDIPTALVTVSLSIASEDGHERDEALDYPEKLVKQTGWNAEYNLNVAGALKYLEYDFFKKWMMRRLADAEGGPVDTSKDHEFTDWDALTEFIDKFASDCLPTQ
jgi:menaquinone-dependent protoporphyrinogen oxidase